MIPRRYAFPLAIGLLVQGASLAQVERFAPPAGGPPQAADLRIRESFKYVANQLVCAGSGESKQMLDAKGRVDTYPSAPSNPHAWAGMAFYRLKALEFGDGYLDWRSIDEAVGRAVALGPSEWEPYWVLAMVKIRQRDVQGARRAIAKAAELNGDSEAIGLARGELALSRAAGKEAEDAFRAAMPAAGKRGGFFTDPVIEIGLADALKLQKRYREAVVAYKDAEGHLLGKQCQYRSIYGQASTLLLYEGDAAGAEPLIGSRALEGKPGEMELLAALLPYVKELQGAAAGRPILSPEEAALELVKVPVGAKLIPLLIKSKRLRDVDVLDGKGNSLLILAAQAGVTEVADMLVKAGANVDRANRASERALTFFAAYGNAPGVKLMINARAQVDYKDKDGTSPLLAAVSGGSPPAVRMLLEKARRPGADEMAGLLLMACYAGNLEVAKALVQAGGTVAPPNDQAMPPLIAAIFSGNRDLVVWMLGQKADPSVTFRGRKATDFARDTGDPEMVKIFVQSRGV